MNTHHQNKSTISGRIPKKPRVGERGNRSSRSDDNIAGGGNDQQQQREYNNTAATATATTTATAIKDEIDPVAEARKALEAFAEVSAEVITKDLSIIKKENISMIKQQQGQRDSSQSNRNSSSK